MKGTVLAVLMLAGSAAAQTSYPPAPPARPATSPPASTAASVPAQVDPSQLLTQVGRASSALNTSLAGLRIEKWKTGGQDKNQLQSNADSMRRNLITALPGIIQDVRNAPDNLGATFKLYRNLSALYDVLASLTEAAGSSGSKEESRDLSQQLQQISALRRSLGDRMEQLAALKDAQITRLNAQLKQATAATPPKKIVVDDNQDPKPKKKKTPSATTAQTDSKPQP